MTPWTRIRARLSEVLGRPVPSHEQVEHTLMELCDRVEALTAELAARPGVVYGRWTMPELDRLHAELGLGELWQASERRAELLVQAAQQPAGDANSPPTGTGVQSEGC